MPTHLQQTGNIAAQRVCVSVCTSVRVRVCASVSEVERIRVRVCAAVCVCMCACVCECAHACTCGRDKARGTCIITITFIACWYDSSVPLYVKSPGISNTRSSSSPMCICECMV